MEIAKILLADDHAVVRAGIRNALTDLPNLEIVGEVGDGRALLASLAETQPDCLLIDVAMPNFEPVVTIRQIRASYPDLKILVVSAYDDDEYVQGMLGAGVNGYHLKDQSLNDLKLAVQRILAGERWVSSRLVNKLMAFSGLQPASNLTNRQREILRLLQQGFDNHTIARQMGLSIKTIENHLTRLYRQLNVQSRLEAVNFVIQHPEILGKPGRPPLPLDDLSEGALAEKITILVVDDNLRYRHQLRRMLGRVCPQATIYEAGNIQTATNTAQDVKPHLALVDVVLGDEDGIGCTRRLKAQCPSLRVVLISAYPDREFHRLGLEAGAVAFLDKKDLDAAALRQVINDVV
jgi:DNA-binding NarL/FixJ family response regulator